jgi:hypothetical protein
MAVLYGAQVYQENRNESDIRYDLLATDSEEFNVGDPVTCVSGQIEVVDAATDEVLGVAVKKQTAGATNTTLYPGYIPATQDTVFLMGTNSDLTDNETDFGKFYGLTGATGAIQVNVSGGETTTTSRQVVIVKVDPRVIGGSGAASGLREVLVKFFRTPFQNTGANT